MRHGPPSWSHFISFEEISLFSLSAACWIWRSGDSYATASWSLRPSPFGLSFSLLPLAALDPSLKPAQDILMNKSRQGWYLLNSKCKRKFLFSIIQDVLNLEQKTNLLLYSCSNFTINCERNERRVGQGLYHLISQRSPISVAGIAAKRARSDFSDSSSFWLDRLGIYTWHPKMFSFLSYFQPIPLCSYLISRSSFWSFFLSSLQPKFAIGPKRFQSHQPEIIPALPSLSLSLMPFSEWENFAV